MILFQSGLITTNSRLPSPSGLLKAHDSSVQQWMALQCCINLRALETCVARAVQFQQQVNISRHV